MAIKNSTPRKRDVQPDWGTVAALAEFPIAGGEPTDDEQVAERQLTEFRRIGVSAGMTDNPDDGFEFIGPDGATEGCGTPPRSAQDRVQAIIAAQRYKDIKAAQDGSKRRAGRSNGKASTAQQQNARALVLIDVRFPDWRSRPLARATLGAMAHFLKVSHSIHKNPDTLRHLLKRSLG